MSEAHSGEPASLGSYSQVVARLAASQKSGRGAPAYSRYINRPLGRRFAALAYLAGLTPNAVTVISAFASFTALGLVIALRPSIPLGIAVAVLLVLGYALDAADGQLARLTGAGSLSGEWLDHMVDCFKLSTLHMAVAISMYRFWDVDRAWLLVPVVLVVIDNAGFFGQILNEQLKRSRGSGASSSSSSALVSLLKIPTDYGTLCLIFAVFGVTDVFLALYTAVAVLGTVYLVLVLPRWYHQMRELDRAGASS